MYIMDRVSTGVTPPKNDAMRILERQSDDALSTSREISTSRIIGFSILLISNDLKSESIISTS